MAKKPKPPSPVEGRWRITSMEMWDQEFVDAEVEGYFEFRPSGTMRRADPILSAGLGVGGRVGLVGGRVRCSRPGVLGLCGLQPCLERVGGDA